MNVSWGIFMSTFNFKEDYIHRKFVKFFRSKRKNCFVDFFDFFLIEDCLTSFLIVGQCREILFDNKYQSTPIIFTDTSVLYDGRVQTKINKKWLEFMLKPNLWEITTYNSVEEIVFSD